MAIDENLKQYATDRQWEVYCAVDECGTREKASRKLNISLREVYRHIAKLKGKAARQGYSPDHDMMRPVPDGFHLKGTSTLYDPATGEQKLQWVKSGIDQRRQEILLQEAAEAMAEDLPRVTLMAAPPKGNDDLLNLYVVTDYHLGMLAWHEETKDEDYDLKIAEKQLINWFRCAIAQSPDANTGIFAQLGDFLHWDGLDAVTPAHKNLLDADTRFQKLVRVAIRVLRQVIDMLLSKHQKLIVILAEGNHDPASSIWLREWFSAIYENEPRIEIDRNPDPYYCIEFGSTSLFFHHGHKSKMANVIDVFVAKFRDIFGRTKHSYGHTGHLHHVHVKENNLMIAEQHRTLAPNDAYASRGGWISGRDAKVITYHREFGEVSRIIINSDMVKESAA